MSGDGRSGKNLTVLDGSTFFVSDPSGDVEAEHADGFFHADMRHLSTWRLLVGGESPRTLSSQTVDYYSARVVGGVSEDGDAATIAVRRERFLSGGVHEDVILENLTGDPRQVELVLEFASDFGDILECHERPKKQGRTTRHAGEQEVTLRYKREDFVRDRPSLRRGVHGRPRPRDLRRGPRRPADLEDLRGHRSGRGRNRASVAAPLRRVRKA